MRSETRPIPSYPGYFASSAGHVYSTRQGSLKQLKECPLPRYPNYRRVNVWRDAKQTTRLIHDLVLTTFVGPRPKGLQGRHLDGDSQNNRLKNLKWGTRLENAADMKSHGRTLEGEKNPQAKLTTNNVIKIRSRLRTCSQASLAKQFGVAQKTIDDVARGRTWRHVEAQQ